MSIKTTFSYNQQNKSILYLVPTPVGNILDITQRAKEILQSADIIACEDTRNTKALLTRLGITPKSMISCYSQKELITAQKLIMRMKEENLIVAYCSDAGSPGISDPGGILATIAIENDIPVSSLPGPTAFVPALTSSGFDTAQFTFVGFLPVKENVRIKTLSLYQNRSETLIFYEAPHRLKDTLLSMSKVFGKDRRVSLGREISKMYEQYIRGTFEDVIDLDEKLIRGEFVIIVEGKKEEIHYTEEELIEIIKSELTSSKTISDISRDIASNTGLSKNYIYKLVTKVKNDN